MSTWPRIVLLASALALFAAGCATRETKPAPARFKADAPAGMLLIEAEAFRLLDADIVDDPAASDGKAVNMRSPRSFNSFELDLSPGQYVAVVRARAEDAEHDDFFLSTLTSQAAFKAGTFGRYGWCRERLEFAIKKNVKDFIQFAGFSAQVPKGESGVIVDYIVISEKSLWEAAPLELE